MVAITHGHSDHIGGMHSVLSNFRPHELWIGTLPPTPSIHALLEHARSLGIRVIQHNGGDTFEFGGMEANVFSPPATWHASSQPRNNDSLVLRFRFLDSSVLLEGDAEGMIEERMATSYDLHADLLKVAHHGSSTSSSPKFLNAVRPHWAVISVGGRNTFAHPRIDVLKRLQEAGTATYRMDMNGAVTFYLDGHTVSPQLACLR